MSPGGNGEVTEYDIRHPGWGRCPCCEALGEVCVLCDNKIDESFEQGMRELDPN